MTLTTAATAATMIQHQEQEPPATDQKKLRKDLKLPLGQQQSLQKPPLPVKRFQLNSPAAAGKLLNSKNLPRNLQKFAEAKQDMKETVMTALTQQPQRKEEEPKERKTPRVLSKPQYACFLQEPSSSPPVKNPVQRSRSNEFQKTFTTCSSSNTVSRSNSLRNLENRARSQTSLLFPAEVNSKDKLSQFSKNAFTTPQTPLANVSNLKTPCNSKNLSELKSFFEIKAECKDLSQSLNNLVDHTVESLKFKENLCKSVENFSLQQNYVELTGNFVKQETKSLENLKSLTNNKEKIGNSNNKTKNMDENKESTKNSNKITKTTLKTKQLENSPRITDLNELKSNKITKIETNSKNNDNFPALAYSTHLKHVASVDCEVNTDASNLAALATVSAKSQQKPQDSAKNCEDFTKLTLKSVKTTEIVKKPLDKANEIYILEKSSNKTPNSYNINSKTQNLTDNLTNITKQQTKSLENLLNFPMKSQKNHSFEESLKDSINLSYRTQYLTADLSNMSQKLTKSLENLTSKGNLSTNSAINLEKTKDLPENLTIISEQQQTKSLENLTNKGNLEKTKDSFNLNSLTHNLATISQQQQTKSLERLSSKENVLNSLEISEKAKDFDINLQENLSKVLENLNKSIDILSSAGIKSGKSLSLSSNTYYSLDYDTKVNENLSCREFKSMENLSHCNSQDSLSLSVTADNLKEYSLKITENLTNKNKQTVNNAKKSKSQDNLWNNTSKLSLKESGFSNENFNDFKDYSLYRNIKTGATYNKKSDIPDCLINSKSKSPNSLRLTENLEELRSKSVDNIDLVVKVIGNHSKSLDNIDLTKSIDNIEKPPQNSVDILESLIYSKDLSGVSKEDFQNVLKSEEKSLEKNIKINRADETPAKYKEETIGNLSSNTHILKEDSSTNKLNSDMTNFDKYLQISMDSLEALEDAVETNTKDLKASEILEEGLNSDSQYDFNKLLTLKKSKTEYCLQSLDKSSSEEDSPSFEETNYISACNTLQSKWSSKPNETNETVAESLANKPAELRPKKPKTLRSKTTEKILTLTSMATHNVSTYASFRKSKMFYKNASKSFKNSLRFYETFSEKTSHNTQPPSPVKRSLSLPDKRPELNRKIFAKTGKMKMKGGNAGEWYSPTENSYSFDYYDNVGDVNGKLVKEETKEEEVTHPALIIKENFDENLMDKEENLEIEDLKENLVKNSRVIEVVEENSDNFLEKPIISLKDSNNKIHLTAQSVNLSQLNDNLVETELSNKEISSNDLNLSDDILISEKSLNLKPQAVDSYFTNSLQTFKGIYEATTLVDKQESQEESTLDSEEQYYSILSITDEMPTNSDSTKELSFLAENSSSLAAETTQVEAIPFKSSSVSVFSVNTSKFQPKSSISPKIKESTTFFDNSATAFTDAGSRFKNSSIVTTSDHISTLFTKTIEESLPNTSHSLKKYDSFNAGTRNVATKVESFSRNNLKPTKFCENSYKKENFSRIFQNSSTNNSFNQESIEIAVNSPDNFSKFHDNPSTSISNAETSLEFMESPEIANNSAASALKSRKFPENTSKFPYNTPESGNLFNFSTNSKANDEISSVTIASTEISNNSFIAGNLPGFSTPNVEKLSFPGFYSSQTADASKVSNNSHEFVTNSLLNENLSNSVDNLNPKLETASKCCSSSSIAENNSNPNPNMETLSGKSFSSTDSLRFNDNSSIAENVINPKLKLETLSGKSFPATDSLRFKVNSTKFCSKSFNDEKELKISPSTVETLKSNVDSNEFSFNLKKFSLNCSKFPENPLKMQDSANKFNENSINFSKLSFNSFDSSKIPDNLEISSENSANKFHNFNENNINSLDSSNSSLNPLDSSNIPDSSLLNENSSNESSSKPLNVYANSLRNECNFNKNTDSSNLYASNSLNSSSPQFLQTKFVKQNPQFNITPTTTHTTTTTTTTLTVKDFNKTECSTTITTTITTPTNFPTKVVAMNNLQQQPTNISYTNSASSSSSCSSLSSLRTTNKSCADTAKYQQNQKATIVTPAPPLKKLANVNNPPKVLPRRLFVNARTATTTNTMTSTTCTTSSSTCTATTTTSSTCFKASSTNNNAPSPLRRRIPGNTLYYV